MRSALARALKEYGLRRRQDGAMLNNRCVDEPVGAVARGACGRVDQSGSDDFQSDAVAGVDARADRAGQGCQELFRVAHGVRAEAP